MRKAAILMGAFAAGVALMLLAWPRREPPVAPVPPVEKTRERPVETVKDSAAARRLAVEAAAKLQEGQVQDAEVLLERAERLDDALALVPLTRGRMAMARKEYALARRDFEKALALSEDEEAHGDLADALFHTGAYAGAIEEATKGKRLFTRAAAYAALGEDEAALKDYTAHTAVHAEDAAAWLNRGNLEMRMKRNERAIASWERAVTLDPSLKEELEGLIRRARE